VNTRINVRVEWDMGHRLAHHDGKCSRLHGHRYAAEVTLEDVVKNGTMSDSDEGMVMDFGRLKHAVQQAIAGWDHSFLVSDRDPMVGVLALKGIVVVPWAPTAENIAAALFAHLSHAYGERVKVVRLYETPTCYAEVTR
jgi:6-pyruvoyltetrahydropterin/6-carboxytetrahydropterin synthase